MKIDDLARATESATKWRYLVQLERTLRDTPWLFVDKLHIPASINDGITLQDLLHTGLSSENLNDAIRDVVAGLLDKQASLILSEMEVVGMDTESLARDREELIVKLDEKEKKRRSRGE